MKFSILSAIIFIQSTFLIAQEKFKSAQFRVSKHDITTNVFEMDSTANALVLYEYGKSQITESDLELVTEYKKKVKILKREGFDAATIEILLYRNENKRESVRDISAATYTLVNGVVERTELKKEDIFSEAYSENYKLVKFTLPKLKVGSVFTYSYVIDSPFLFNYYEWSFQEDIPKIYSEYDTSIPAIFQYNIKLRGFQELDVHESDIRKECVTYNLASTYCTKVKYVMKDIPAFVEEDYMTTKNNYLSKIEYELKSIQNFSGEITNYTKTWKSVDYDIKKNRKLGTELRKKSVVKNVLPVAIVEEPDLLEKAKKIYEYVQDTYVWNNEYLFFDEVSLKNIVNEKSGDIAEINGLLYALLHKHGVEAYPVLLSTRKNGVPTKLFPVLSEFNYVLVKVAVDGKDYLLDASDKDLIFGQIPFRCLNEYGRMLDFENESEWVPIKANKNSRIAFGVNLKMDNNGQLQGVVKSNYSGYHALNKKKEEVDFEKAYLDENEEIDIVSYSIVNNGKENGRYQEVFEIEYSADDSNTELLYMDPFLIKFFTKNPFQLQRRSYPIDFGFKDSYTYFYAIEVGDAYEIVEYPDNIIVQLPNGKGEVKLNCSVVGNKLQMTFFLIFREALYNHEYYEGLKLMMKHTIDAQTKSLIVLKKRKDIE